MSEPLHDDVIVAGNTPGTAIDAGTIPPCDKQQPPRFLLKTADHDDVNHPRHYTSHPSGVECIDITECYNFNVGNAIKYLWRAGLKTDNPITDLRKAIWYAQREIERVQTYEVKADA